ncbi:hypothetical protein ACFOMD_08085 [Sphingoaurantiacus capsulatus]|uniref:Glycosyltransferase n=1 Tax=Sphingoaurantiacus capsulatus TaxID=1771310 RepID=A0ABV7XB53_9SPHN
MATLLGTWELGQGYGHIAHLAPVAAALNARGHRMAVAARNPATADAVPGAPFAGVIEPPIYHPAARQPETINYAQVIGDGGFADLPAMRLMVRRWLEIFEAVKPTAIVAEHAPVSLLAAHVAGLPAAMLGAGFLVPPAQQPLPSLMPWKGHDDAALLAAGAAADASVQAICVEFGAPMLDSVATLLARGPAYLTTWPEVDPYGPRTGVTYYGTMNGFRVSARAAWPAGDGPRAFVYFPFAHPAAGALIEALAQLGWPVLWHSVGAEAPPLPPNIIHSPQPLDMPATLGEAALLISRGGHATSCEAILAGTPNLVLPDSLDTVLIGRKLTANRLGGATVQRDGLGIAAAIEAMMSDAAIAAGVAAAATRYVPYRGERAAAQLAAQIVADFAL